MNLGVGDYYSIIGNRYVKQANVEVIGVDSNEPYVEDKATKFSQSLIYQSQKNFSREPVIKEEEIQYDLQQTLQLNERSNKKRQFSKLSDKSQVNSVYLRNETIVAEQYPTYSLIANNPSKNRANIKQKLEQMQKIKLRSEYQEDSFNDEKELYLQLEKQKKKRMDLQRQYKKLLSNLQNPQNDTEVEENEREIPTERKRQYSKRTLKGNNQQQTLISSQSARLNKPSIKQKQNKSTQIYRISQFRPKDNIYIQESEVCSENIEQLEQQSQIKSNHSRKSEQIFQEHLLQHLKYLHQKVQKIDSFLTQKEKTLENQALKRQIAQKQKEIQRIRQQKMSQVKIVEQNNTNIGIPQTKKQLNLSQVVHYINHADTTTLYLGCLIIMIVMVIIV